MTPPSLLEPAGNSGTVNPHCPLKGTFILFIVIVVFVVVVIVISSSRSSCAAPDRRKLQL